MFDVSRLGAFRYGFFQDIWNVMETLGIDALTKSEVEEIRDFKLDEERKGRPPQNPSPKKALEDPYSVFKRLNPAYKGSAEDFKKALKEQIQIKVKKKNSGCSGCKKKKNASN